MKEREILDTIARIINSEYIGDDCAYLKDLGIVVTSDSLVEGVHFLREFTDAYKLGFKSAMVNISDIAASGAEPLYLTVSLSLPSDIDNEFISEFYKGLQSACKSAKIIGGDITGGDKIYISITAIGKTLHRKISSRSYAKVGQKIIVSGYHGSSAAGLQQLYRGNKNGKFVNSHLMPEAQINFSKYISSNIQSDYAMMDTSDGLADALLQIANCSNVLMSVTFDKIPYDKDLEEFSNVKDLILYGGEDYQLIACVDKDFEVPNSFTIGEVKQGLGVELDGEMLTDFNKKIFDHFK